MEWSVLEKVWTTIQARRESDPDDSWTARLLSEGPEHIARKLGEEALETMIEALRRDRPGRLAEESADLLYHLMVLWTACGVTPEAVLRVLEARRGVSGLAERAARADRLAPG